MADLVIDQMTRKDFEAVPYRKGWSTKEIFDSFVILPTRRKHDSGYRCMDFIAVKDNRPVCRLSGCSDVVHFNGIGGFGYRWVEEYARCPETVPVTAWNMDCLHKSGLLRVWADRCELLNEDALSSFRVYAIKSSRANP